MSFKPTHAADIELRKATRNDADHMAKLINLAGEGLPVYLWQEMIEGDETAWDVGRRRALREEGGFSYHNTRFAFGENQIMGAIIAYAQPDHFDPIDPAEIPAMFVPILELESLAPGSWYINVLAVYPPFHNRGIGSFLVRAAEEDARKAGKTSVSIIASDGNPGAVRLYERLGYTACASRKMVKEGWENPGENWILLIKEI
ncbi:GNAT family N-acetyltransferase [Thalassospira sp. HF15]|uniref:GNAT family N-acetyltransferase n=1 Tax=Thalassospira sp. HF15 TaxID=2722755 RepID=UPI0014317D1F|nr:GNAT family N-acetyltransferase [Thalassospira sp. HF15]NIY76084.1 GNAT family N-acetyltransferase [Thalassospira sp. HF15]